MNCSAVIPHSATSPNSNAGHGGPDGCPCGQGRRGQTLSPARSKESPAPLPHRPAGPSSPRWSAAARILLRLYQLSYALFLPDFQAELLNGVAAKAVEIVLVFRWPCRAFDQRSRPDDRRWKRSACWNRGCSSANGSSAIRMRRAWPSRSRPACRWSIRCCWKQVNRIAGFASLSATGAQAGAARCRARRAGP